MAGSAARTLAIAMMVVDLENFMMLFVSVVTYSLCDDVVCGLRYAVDNGGGLFVAFYLSYG